MEQRHNEENKRYRPKINLPIQTIKVEKKEPKENERYIVENINIKKSNTLSDSALNNIEIDFKKIEIILNKLEKKYEKYLYNLIDNKDELIYRTKRELHVNEFLNNIQAILKILSQTPKQLYINLFKG